MGCSRPVVLVLCWSLTVLCWAVVVLGGVQPVIESVATYYLTIFTPNSIITYLESVQTIARSNGLLNPSLALLPGNDGEKFCPSYTFALSHPP